MKEIVKLRQKVGKTTGVASLFLEWRENGKRRFEFLNMYIRPGKDPETRRLNKLTMDAAKTIQAQRIVQKQNEIAGIVTKSRATMGEQFSAYKRSHVRLSANYIKALDYAWHCWEGIIGDCQLSDIRKRHMMDFSKGLTGMMSPSSASHIYNIVSTILQSAVRDEILDRNPAKMLDLTERPRGASAEREFLTLDEIRTLDATPCRSPMLKMAFLFSCFTGLRLSDIITLRWGMIAEGMIQKRMVKTRETIYQPLSVNARRYLPERGAPEDPVFVLKEDTQNRRDLASWMKDAGITKHITFHCARHTFACLLIEYDADIYTVSKLLGHRNVQTTQIYARIMDRKKEEAINLIPDV